MMWLSFERHINAFRTNVLGLEPLRVGNGGWNHLNTMKVRNTLVIYWGYQGSSFCVFVWMCRFHLEIVFGLHMCCAQYVVSDVWLVMSFSRYLL